MQDKVNVLVTYGENSMLLHYVTFTTIEKKKHKWLEVEWILLKIEAVTWRIAIRKYQTGAL